MSLSVYVSIQPQLSNFITNTFPFPTQLKNIIFLSIRIAYIVYSSCYNHSIWSFIPDQGAAWILRAGQPKRKNANFGI